MEMEQQRRNHLDRQHADTNRWVCARNRDHRLDSQPDLLARPEALRLQDCRWDRADRPLAAEIYAGAIKDLHVLCFG
mgnify:CR=1 FL=1